MPAIQTAYGSRIRPALVGMLVDLTEAEVGSFIVNEPGGVGFGVVVSQDPLMPKGIRKGGFGGQAAIGVLIRDVTMDGTPVLPNAVDRAPVDQFDRWRTAPVATRGRVWVVADSDVVADAPAYYDYDTGLIGASASGRSAYGYINFTAQPSNGQTVTVNGVTFTFIASGTPSATQALIGASLGESVENMVAKLNASANGSVSVATYEVNQLTPDHTGTQIRVSYDTVGPAGNAFTLATNVTGATRSGATLTGGGAGDKATASVIFATNPVDGDTLTLNGTVVTFADSPTTGQVQIGADLATTLASLKTLLNASADAQIAKNTYDVVDAGTTLTIASKTSGTAMNAYTIATDVAGAVPSGPAMIGGTPDAVLLTGARWVNSALAGDLAQLSLSQQL